MTLTYDNLNRLLQENYSGNSISFGYSINGMVTSATDSASGTVETFAYDNLNRAISETTIFSGVTGTLTQAWSYDKASNVTGYTYKNSGTLIFSNNYTYNALNQLVTLAQIDGGSSIVNNKSVLLAYDLNGNATNITRYANLTHSGTTGKVAATTLVYDPYNNRLVSESHALGTSGSTTLVYSQSYNIASQIIALATADGTSSLTYDNLGQLLTVSVGAMPAESFSLDASGNRNSAGYTTGSDNQMTAAPNLASTTSHYEYAYDYEGNTTDKYLKNGTANIEHTVYTWDFKNRLTQAQTYTVSGTVQTLTQTVEISYDAFGHRVNEKVTDNAHSNTVTQDERYLYNGSNLTATVNASTLATQQVFLMGLQQNQVFAQDTVGTSSTMTRWGLTDHQGTVRDVISSSGTQLDHIVYSSFGNIVSQSSTTNAMTMLYTGQIYDIPTGLFYYNARWYDAANGRFTSVDPIGFKSGQTDLYVYCANDPVKLLDPTGTMALPSWIPYLGVPVTIAGLVYGVGSYAIEKTAHSYDEPTARTNICPTDPNTKGLQGTFSVVTEEKLFSRRGRETIESVFEVQYHPSEREKKIVARGHGRIVLVQVFNDGDPHIDIGYDETLTKANKKTLTGINPPTQLDANPNVAGALPDGLSYFDAPEKNGKITVMAIARFKETFDPHIGGGGGADIQLNSITFNWNAADGSVDVEGTHLKGGAAGGDRKDDLQNIIADSDWVDALRAWRGAATYTH